MKLSYEGIGAWSATFSANDVAEGQVVKLSGSGAVTKCGSGDGFCGVACSVRGTVCGVQLSGLAEVAYSGSSAPAVGLTALTADGSGGVCAAENGQSYLVVSVDEAAGKCVIRL